MKGFITKLNPNTGNLIIDGGDTAKATTLINSSKPPSSTNAPQDWASGVCTIPGSDEFIYVVGSSGGILDASVPQGNLPKEGDQYAYISKVRIQNLEPVWTKQFVTTNGLGGSEKAASFAIDCAVTSDGSKVYVAGTVQQDSALQGITDPNYQATGGDDIFIAQLSANGDNIYWVQQYGSSHTDRLAHGGKALLVDNQDNAILYGETTGRLFRSRDNDSVKTISDIFVLTVDSDGYITDAAEFGGASNNGGNSGSTGQNIDEWEAPENDDTEPILPPRNKNTRK